MDTPPPLAAGHRARVGAHRATVRYVGSVQGQEGQWVGLEWDEAGRGKHDGTVDGTRWVGLGMRVLACVHAIHPWRA